MLRQKFKNVHSTVIGEDYSPSTPFVIAYSVGDPGEACASITIQDDASLEGNHNFTVAITSTSLDPDAIGIPPSSLHILIRDDERKCFQ